MTTPITPCHHDAMIRTGTIVSMMSAQATSHERSRLPDSAPRPIIHQPRIESPCVARLARSIAPIGRVSPACLTWPTNGAEGGVRIIHPASRGTAARGSRTSTSRVLSRRFSGIRARSRI